MREHCWWYSEAVFEAMLRFHESLDNVESSGVQPVVKHWPWAAYRYSYIVVGKRLCKRDVLMHAAKEFRDMNARGRMMW
jgi:hypothetical protein